jgi:hypothetical protein
LDGGSRRGNGGRRAGSAYRRPAGDRCPSAARSMSAAFSSDCPLDMVTKPEDRNISGQNGLMQKTDYILLQKVHVSM